MKRIMTMIAAVAVSATMLANGNDAEYVMPEADYNVRMDNAAITSLLNLNAEQAAQMATVHDRFESNMQKATDKDSESANKIAKKAIMKDLCGMRPILNDKQFRAYRGVLNATILDHSIMYY